MYKCIHVKRISKIWILPETVSTPRVRTSWESSHCKAYKVPTWKWWPSDPKKCGCQIQSRYLSDEQHPNPQTSSVWTLALTDGWYKNSWDSFEYQAMGHWSTNHGGHSLEAWWVIASFVGSPGSLPGYQHQAIYHPVGSWIVWIVHNWIVHSCPFTCENVWDVN